MKRVYLGAHNIVSPLAFTSRDNFVRMARGESGIRQLTFPFSENGIYAAQLNENDLNLRFQKLGDPALYTKLERMCLLSINDVIQQSTVDLRKSDTLLILSTTKGNIDVLAGTYPDIDPKRAYLAEFGKTIGTYFSAANVPLVVSNACISGLLAIIIAKRYLEVGAYKNVIVCGADLVSEFTVSGFKSFNAISPSICRPFDAKREGINLGEAASSLLLSTDAISQVIISAGASANDANHISGPSRTGDGLFQAVHTCLKTIDHAGIDLISAHGTATEYNDEMEAVAFHRLNLDHIPLNSLKGYYGHTLGAAGVLESVLSVVSLLQNTLIRSLGFNETGTTQAVNIITQTKHQELQRCLKTASGFGGCNAAAVFEKI